MHVTCLSVTETTTGWHRHFGLRTNSITETQSIRLIHWRQATYRQSTSWVDAGPIVQSASEATQSGCNTRTGRPRPAEWKRDALNCWTCQTCIYGVCHQSQSQSDTASGTLSSALPPASPLEDHSASSTVTTSRQFLFLFSPYFPTDLIKISLYTNICLFSQDQRFCFTSCTPSCASRYFKLDHALKSAKLMESFTFEWVWYILLSINHFSYNMSTRRKNHIILKTSTTSCLRKKQAKLFLLWLRQTSTKSDNFWQKMANSLKLYEVHLFSTSLNSCHCTTVLNADVPNCYITL